MNFIEDWTEQRRQVADWYREDLADVDLILPQERDDVRHVYHLFVARSPRRGELIASLAKSNIFCGIHYPNPLCRAQRFMNAPTVPMDLPVCSSLYEMLPEPRRPILHFKHWRYVWRIQRINDKKLLCQPCRNDSQRVRGCQAQCRFIDT